MIALPAGWREMTLGQLCSSPGGGIQTGPFGSQLHASDYVTEGIPSVMPQNIGDNVINEAGIARITAGDAERLSRYRLRSGDIVYSRRGDVERRALVRRANDGWLCGTGCLRVRLGDGPDDSRFVSYALGTEWTREWIVRHAVGATMLNLNTSILASVSLWVPPVMEQRAIAEVLGALDDKIAANTNLARTADEFLCQRYRAAIAADSVTLPLLERLDVDFGEPFKGGQFCEPGSGRPLIRIRDLKTFTPQVWTAERRARETVIEPGDVVLGMDAEFRATAWLGVPGLLNQRVCRVRGDGLGRALVREAVKEPLAAIEAEKTGTTVIHLNKRDLERAAVVIPSDDRAQSFNRVSEPVYQARLAAAEENRTLAALRDTLLPQLMSGKLRVRDAEKVAETVL